MKTAAMIVALCGITIGGIISAQTPTNTPSMSPQQCIDMMKSMGVSNGMIMRCRMMGTARIDAYDPASILALRGDLSLTDEQVKSLEAIVASERDNAKKVLTAEQAAKLEPMAGTPTNMTDMCRQMQPMMKKHGASPMMMCPWMKQ